MSDHFTTLQSKGLKLPNVPAGGSPDNIAILVSFQSKTNSKLDYTKYNISIVGWNWTYIRSLKITLVDFYMGEIIQEWTK